MKKPLTPSQRKKIRDMGKDKSTLSYDWTPQGLERAVAKLSQPISFDKLLEKLPNPFKGGK